MSYAQPRTMMSFIKESKIVHLCCGITFFMSGVIINFIQFLLFITVRTVSKSLYRKINWYFNASIYGQLVFMADWWANLDLEYFIDKDDYDKYYGKEHAYCIMNHTFEIDWLVGWVTADKINLLGNCKAYIKKELQYMPVLGWAWRLSDFIILNRSFEKDKDIINTQISELGDYPDPMWILMFSEGTRFTEAKHQASEQFAREKNLAPLKYHLQPRTRGFVASLPSMQGKVPAVYDIIVAFKENDIKPSVSNLIHGKAAKGYIYINRIPMEEVPKTPAEQEKFLYEMYARKDKMRESFINTGDFFATSGIKRVPGFKVRPRLYILLNFIIWNSLILFPMLYYLTTSLFSGELFHFSIAAGIIVFFILMLYKIVGMSKISKGSTYGTNSPKKTT